MGSPLSPLLAEAYMDDFEQQLFCENPPILQNILIYKRYVDDIFILWTGDTSEVQDLLHHVNQLRENIKFEIEIGGETLNFLDLTIKLNLSTRKLEFSVYRKPSTTDTCIPANSNHPQIHKMAAFRALISRLLEIPMSRSNFINELDVIYQIATNNGYKKETIVKLFNVPTSSKLY
uniref:Reverse transcriptase domain-containing protein n=1 Tax=Cacopsylla melanoneura TaxID=428564 RepID=A0A8D8XCL7_9HEMI